MLDPADNLELPSIPSKRYFTIGEVSELCAVKPHVLRYWEQEFPQLKPVKRRGNRRYYQRQDVLVIRQIRSLLYEQGFTIGGGRNRLDGEEAREDVTQTQQLVRQLRVELGEQHGGRAGVRGVERKQAGPAARQLRDDGGQAEVVDVHRTNRRALRPSDAP